MTALAAAPRPRVDFDRSRGKTKRWERMVDQIPSLGRIVHYRLSADDVAQINRRRTTGASIADRMKLELDRLNHERDEGVQAFAWPAGAQAHIGNEAHEGDVFPMLIVAVWGTTPSSCVNGQVFLDGCDVFWALSRSVGDGPGTWSWPPRV
jgi:hypothetical protein